MPGMLFHETCLAGLKPSQVVPVHKIVINAIFAFVSMISISCMLKDSKTVTLQDVHDSLAVIHKKSKRVTGGALGTPFTGLAGHTYSTSNGSDVTHAATVNFGEGIARPAHDMKGGSKKCALSAQIESEVCLILKDQGMRKNKDALNAIVLFLKARIDEFVAPLQGKQHEANAADVGRAAKRAFKGLRIM